MNALPQTWASTALVPETCCVCGCAFAMPAEMQRNRRECGTSFYCPNGHGMSYTVLET